MVLKRVLLAYARWNKAVGYCQGFNVLAALILEVTEGNESDALKVKCRFIKKKKKSTLNCSYALKNAAVHLSP